MAEGSTVDVVAVVSQWLCKSKHAGEIVVNWLHNDERDLANEVVTYVLARAAQAAANRDFRLPDDE